MFSRKFWHGILLLTLIAFGAMLSSSVVEAQGPQDPAFFDPSIAAFVKKYGKDWEKFVHPDLRIVIQFQRIVGTHAIIAGYSDEKPNAQYTNPKFVLRVYQWDGTDLFKLGIPRVYNGKPVEIVDIKQLPKVN